MNKIKHIKIVKPYVDDFYTVHKDLLIYLESPESTIGEATYNRKKYVMICPECHIGKVKTTLAQLVINGFSCPCCGNKGSYFNRFGHYMLTELNEDFESEKRFDWCKFPNYKNPKKIYSGVYDFVIESKKLIIEMDGGFHKTGTSTKSQDEVKYVDKMKTELAKLNGYRVIRIDCDYGIVKDRFRIFVNNLLNSELKDIYSLDKLDLDKIDILANKNITKEVSEYWNQGYTIPEIVNISTYCTSTVRTYLRKGAKIGWCNFEEGKSRSRGYKIKVLQDDNLVGLFESKTKCAKYLREQYQIIFDPDMIAKNINNKIDNYKGLNFIKISNEEFRELLKEQIKDIDISKMTYTNEYARN